MSASHSDPKGPAVTSGESSCYFFPCSLRFFTQTGANENRCC